MSKQRKWQPLQDWVLRKWQLILYTARKPFLHGLGVYSNCGGPGKNHTHTHTHTPEKPKWKGLEKNGGELEPKKEKKQKRQNIGVSCVVGWGGQLWSSIYLSLAIAQPNEVLLLFASVGNNARKAPAERIGEGRVFGVCSSWPCV